jgi:hypothetical protein
MLLHQDNRRNYKIVKIYLHYIVIMIRNNFKKYMNRNKVLIK